MKDGVRARAGLAIGRTGQCPVCWPAFWADEVYLSKKKKVYFFYGPGPAVSHSRGPRSVPSLSVVQAVNLT